LFVIPIPDLALLVWNDVSSKCETVSFAGVTGVETFYMTITILDGHELSPEKFTGRDSG